MNQFQLWMIALSAVLSEMNELDYDSLCGYKKTEKIIQMSKHAMKRDWGITNKTELLSSLNWLFKEGHRNDFLKARYFLSTLSEVAQNDYLKGLSNKSNKYVEYHFVKEYDKKLSRGGIVAWDYGRYVFLCRDGEYVGYISEESADDKLELISKLMLDKESSWCKIDWNTDIKSK